MKKFNRSTLEYSSPIAMLCLTSLLERHFYSSKRCKTRDVVHLRIYWIIFARRCCHYNVSISFVFTFCRLLVLEVPYATTTTVTDRVTAASFGRSASSASFLPSTVLRRLVALKRARAAKARRKATRACRRLGVRGRRCAVLVLSLTIAIFHRLLS